MPKVTVTGKLTYEQLAAVLRGGVDFNAEPPSWSDADALRHAARSVAWAADLWQKAWRLAHVGQVVTKWDLLNERERAALDATPYPHGDSCSECGERFATEGDFARHFTVPNPHLPNIGECHRPRITRGED
jgi:hypothetical protein